MLAQPSYYMNVVLMDYAEYGSQEKIKILTIRAEMLRRGIAGVLKIREKRF